MKLPAIIFLGFIAISISPSIAQPKVCYVGGTPTFANITSQACGAGSSAGLTDVGDLTSADSLIITGTLSTTANNQVVTGPFLIQINSGGTIQVDHLNAELPGSIKVKSGGFLGLEGSLTLPTGSGLAIEDGGSVDSGDTGSDRLIIGTTVVLKGNGACTVSDGEPDTNLPYCAADGISGPTGFSESGENKDSVLPIVLSSFNVVPADNLVALEWETISEENFDYFSVERSENGVDFYEIGTVPGNGNSNQRIQYDFEDENPLFGTSFYRLNAIDYDGSFEEFQILSVEYIPEDVSISIYPNPIRNQSIKLSLGLPNKANTKKIYLYDLGGNLLLEQSIKIGNNEIPFHSTLDQGMYFAKVLIDNYTFTDKLIIR